MPRPAGYDGGLLTQAGFANIRKAGRRQCSFHADWVWEAPMPIEIKCSSCEKRLRVPDNAAGKRVRCPQCKSVISVPGPSGSAVTGGSAVGGQAKYHLKTEDGQTFGPVPKSELDEWFAEGRITAECQILRDGAQQWQWASDLYPQLDGDEATSPDPSATPGPSGSSPSGFPQVGETSPSGSGGASDNPFAFAAQDASPTSRIGGTARSGGGKSYGKDPAILNKVKLPAIFLMVVAGLDIAILLISLGMRMLGVGMMGVAGGDADVMVAMASGVVGIIYNIFVIGINGFILYAAMEMQKLRSWGLSLTAAILAVVPCFACCLFGIPVGIWAIVVLANADVKAAFR